MPPKGYRLKFTDRLIRNRKRIISYNDKVYTGKRKTDTDIENKGV